jgi:hypothetical protein
MVRLYSVSCRDVFFVEFFFQIFSVNDYLVEYLKSTVGEVFLESKDLKE